MIGVERILRQGTRAARMAARLLGVRNTEMPLSPLRSRALIAGHIARKALRHTLRRNRPFRDTVRAAASEALFLELACRNFAPGSMIRNRHGFFPHIFMPDFDGPHFEEAIRRLAFPGFGPNIFYFSLTGSCPCACEYCFARAGGADAPDLGDAPLFDVARKVAELRVPLVNLSGGEPLVRYARTLETVRILSRGCEVRMFTTGIGLTRERLVELRDAGLKGVFVSLDTDDPEAFDRARGKTGSFTAAVDALRMCTEVDMLTFVNTVVDKQRFAHRTDVDRFIRFVDAIDRRIVVNFIPQLATGRGAEADSFRTPDECDVVADRIVSTARDIGRPASLLFGRVDRFIGCPGAGGKLMNLDVDGNITICISRAAVGNILEEPFERIYRRFNDQCQRLKVGFFCCRISDGESEGLLDAERSAQALHEFYESTEDSEWQQVLDRYGGVLQWLLPEA